jgi:hypothetical protein
MQRSTILQYIYLSQCSRFLTKCSNSDIIRFKASPNLVQRAENMFFNSVYFFNARRSYRVIQGIIEMITREDIFFTMRPLPPTLTQTHTVHMLMCDRKEGKVDGIVPMLDYRRKYLNV